VVYAGFAVAALVLVGRALDPDVPALSGDDDVDGSGSATLALGPEQLALQGIGARAERSTVGIGRSTGFVAWERNGLSLVLTARPVRGWRTGEARSLPVAFDGQRFTGTLVRTDDRTGLGLVRVRQTGFADPLWQVRRPARVRRGDLVVLVGRRAARTVEVERAGRNRIYFHASGLAAFAGAPVLDASGRLAGVVDAGGGAVPIDRACGVIRRC
jgi:S1-C subfamily serine protease